MTICTSSQRGGARGDHGLTPASSQRGEAMSTFSSLLAWPLAPEGWEEGDHAHTPWIGVEWGSSTSLEEKG